MLYLYKSKTGKQIVLVDIKQGGRLRTKKFIKINYKKGSVFTESTSFYKDYEYFKEVNLKILKEFNITNEMILYVKNKNPCIITN